MAGGVEQVVLAAAAAAHLRRRADVGAHHPLGLEPIERDVDRRGADIPARAADDLTMDRGAEGAVAQPQQREEHELLELAERRSGRADTHISNNVYQNRLADQR